MFVGDFVDNVFGILFIGLKFVKDLFFRFDMLEGVFNNVDEIFGKKWKENFVNF